MSAQADLTQTGAVDWRDGGISGEISFPLSRHWNKGSEINLAPPAARGGLAITHTLVMIPGMQISIPRSRITFR